jgi:hypothetical protein
MSDILTRRTPEHIVLLNKPTTGFDDLWAKADAIQQKCNDYSVKEVNKNMYLNEDMTLSFKPVQSFEVGRAVAQIKNMSPHAFSQLCTKIGVPVRYMKKCIDAGYLDLVQQNMNTFIEDFEKDLLVRTYDDRVRGILSSKYSVMDTPDIITALNDAVSGHNFQTKGYYLTDERFHARLLQPDFLPIPGEDLFAGLQIDSSDVGRSILIVRIMIFKQVCTNGLTMSKGGGILFEQKHIGITSDEFRAGLKESLERVPDLVASLTESIKGGQKVKLTPKAIEEYLANAKDALDLSDEASKKVVNLMSERYGNTKWGLINGITEVAQEFTLERRLELENYAGELLVA